jgi:hypothetical protein
MSEPNLPAEDDLDEQHEKLYRAILEACNGNNAAVVASALSEAIATLIFVSPADHEEALATLRQSVKSYLTGFAAEAKRKALNS